MTGQAAERTGVAAWRPRVPGVSEVFHARFTTHAYPLHTHQTWTLLILDEGAVSYEIDRHARHALSGQVTLLPPRIPHDGRPATSGGFRKRVLYLDEHTVGSQLADKAVDHPGLNDPALCSSIAGLHDLLAQPGEELAAETRLVLVTQRLRTHLAGRAGTERTDPAPARRLRDLLDAHLVEGITLEHAAALLSTHPAHLVRAFTRAYGLPPHRYLTGRRVERARHLLLDGMPIAEAASAAGFHDQPHLTRHYRRLLGTTPGRYRAAQAR
ncbi:MAG: AraC family transcriptional regulator [Saccharopolyspora sp.]|uniref:helix-turn-helix transcriptional regulator n=1 Tax=unclassified Saccharopolyspora TaxID=2646250 RepID=UPI0025D5272B|nr:AraC family transcriptional regulator [Saccharopolyspora sp.]MBQ6640235.1 AraC family transcriptional regulator [Saccharopolyspora sp.]